MEGSAAPLEQPGVVYRRFNNFHIFAHYLVMIAFFGLVLTGIPIKFPTSFWSRLFLSGIGGVAHAGYLHRAFALLMVLFWVLEVGYMAVYFVKRRGRVFGPDSIMMGLNDLKNLLTMFLWFFGKGKAPLEPFHVLGEVRLLDPSPGEHLDYAERVHAVVP